MAFRREIDDDIHVIHFQHALDGRRVSDIATLEGIIRLVRNGQQVTQIAGVGQLIEDDDARSRLARHHIARESAADETGATRYPRWSSSRAYPDRAEITEVHLQRARQLVAGLQNARNDQSNYQPGVAANFAIRCAPG